MTAPASLPRRVIARIRCDAAIVHHHEEGERCNERCLTVAEFRAERRAHREFMRDWHERRDTSRAEAVLSTEIEDFLAEYERPLT